MFPEMVSQLDQCRISAWAGIYHLDLLFCFIAHGKSDRSGGAVG